MEKEVRKELLSKLSKRFIDLIKNTAFGIVLEQEIEMIINKIDDECVTMDYLTEFFESNVPIEIKKDIYKEIEAELGKITVNDNILGYEKC